MGAIGGAPARQIGISPERRFGPTSSCGPAAWEARVGVHRVFYDVDEANRKVTVKAVGWKEHNRLFIRGKE